MTDSNLCLNCQTPLKGTYCYECGQSIRGTDRFFLTLVNEAFEDVFSLNSRVWKTLGNLMLRPGYLSQEYFAGRRVRYIPPVRLYFTLSILFFLVFSLFSFFQPQPLVNKLSDKPEQNEQSIAVPEQNEDLPEPEKKELDLALNIQDGKVIVADEDDAFDFDRGDLEEFRVSFLSDEENQKLKERFSAQVEKVKAIYKANPDAPSEYFREIAPPIIFCLLPLFALLLKLFYVFKSMYYTQHLILALHIHCFIFLWLTLHTAVDWVLLAVGGTPGWLEFILTAWCIIYLWRSLRVVYQQGRFFTTIKFFTLALSYFFLGGFAFLFAVIFGVLTV